MTELDPIDRIAGTREEQEPMSETRTTTSHYEVQNKRRADVLDYWKENQRFLIRGEDVVMHDTPR